MLCYRATVNSQTAREREKREREKRAKQRTLSFTSLSFFAFLITHTLSRQICANGAAAAVARVEVRYAGGAFATCGLAGDQWGPLAKAPPEVRLRFSPWRRRCRSDACRRRRDCSASMARGESEGRKKGDAGGSGNALCAPSLLQLVPSPCAPEATWCFA